MAQLVAQFDLKVAQLVAQFRSKVAQFDQS
jgi:hypothetical protein